MAETFDPYYRWLGIPADEQPPNHYRLLGLALFEGTADVIEIAADQRMAHLRTFQAGKHAALSQRLLNEVAQAKLCLLQAPKKAAYDKQLRARLAAQEPRRAAEETSPAARVLQAEPLPAAAAAGEVFDSSIREIAEEAKLPRRAAPAPEASRKKTLPVIAVAGAAVLLTAIGGGTYLAMKRPAGQTAPTVVAKNDAAAAPETPHPEPPPEKAPPEIKPQPAPPDPAPAPRAVEAPQLLSPAENVTLPSLERGVQWDFAWSAVPGADKYQIVIRRPGATHAFVTGESPRPLFRYFNPGLRVTEQQTQGWTWQVRARVGEVWSLASPWRTFDATAHSAPKAESPQEPPKDEPPKEDKPAPPQRPVRAALPDKGTQEKLEKEMEEAYDMSKARHPDEKLKLAGKLLEQGRATQKPDEKFVFLRKAAELACDGGDAALMLAALDAIGGDFEVDPLFIKQRLLAKFVEAPASEHRVQSFFETVRDAILADVAADHIEAAADAVAQAKKLAGTSYGKEYRKGVQEWDKQASRLAESWDAVKAAVPQVAAGSEDPALNLQAGRWNSLSKRDWDRGLPQLAKGSNAALKKAAVEELRAPNAADDQVKLGDLWWALGEAAQDDAAAALKAHAGAWYKRALPQLEGLAKAKVTKKLPEIPEEEELFPAINVTAKPGAVALVKTKPKLLRPGLPVDLMPLFDLQRDVVVGKWQRGPNGISCVGDRMNERIMFPVSCTGSYKLELEFTPGTGNDVIVICQTNGVGFNAELSHLSLRVHYSLGGNVSSSYYMGRIHFLAGTRHKLTIAVANTRNGLGMELIFDMPPGLSWSPGPGVVTQPPKFMHLPDGNRPGLCSESGPLTLHSARFWSISGSATLVSGPGAKPGSGPARSNPGHDRPAGSDAKADFHLEAPQ